MALPAVVGIAQGDHPGPVRLVGMVVDRRRGRSSPAGRRTIRRRRRATTRHGPRSPLALRGRARLRRVRPRAALQRARRRRRGRCSRRGSAACRRSAHRCVLARGRGSLPPPTGRSCTIWARWRSSALLDVSANGLYALATRHGLLSVVAVGSSLYPLVTVLLARATARRAGAAQPGGRGGGGARRRRADRRRLTALKPPVRNASPVPPTRTPSCISATVALMCRNLRARGACWTIRTRRGSGDGARLRPDWAPRALPGPAVAR